jgi:large subunit ribosomal protein L3
MTAMWDDFGTKYPVTVLQASPKTSFQRDFIKMGHQMEDCQVTANVETVRKDSSVYHAVQVASTNIRSSRTTKAMKGHFKKAKVPPKRIVKEFPVTADAHVPVGVSPLLSRPSGILIRFLIGTRLSPIHFVPGQYVDLVANS